MTQEVYLLEESIKKEHEKERETLYPTYCSSDSTSARHFCN